MVYHLPTHLAMGFDHFVQWMSNLIRKGSLASIIVMLLFKCWAHLGWLVGTIAPIVHSWGRVSTSFVPLDLVSVYKRLLTGKKKVSNSVLAFFSIYLAFKGCRLSSNTILSNRCSYYQAATSGYDQWWSFFPNSLGSIFYHYKNMKSRHETFKMVTAWFLHGLWLWYVVFWWKCPCVCFSVFTCSPIWVQVCSNLVLCVCMCIFYMSFGNWPQILILAMKVFTNRIIFLVMC